MFINNTLRLFKIIKFYYKRDIIIAMGIGDWGLGIAIPNPQSPIPNPHYK